MEERYQCPCCGYFTLDERGGHDICSVCWWQDDDFGEEYGQPVADRPLGPNHVQLREARLNYQHFGASEERRRVRARPPRPDEMIGENLLTGAVKGNIGAYWALSRKPHERIVELAEQSGRLVLKPSAVRRVLLLLQEGRVSLGLIQGWASFMRWGFMANASRGPIRLIDIDYDSSAEEAIVEIIARLDQIGDLIDGEISRREIETMLVKLG
jgi:hypothetical protein